jgi:hypothetical protein
MVAAGRGYTAVVEQLVNLGANINIKASNDWTAVYLAQKFHHTAVCELGCCGHDRIIVGFTTTYAISAYH